MIQLYTFTISHFSEKARWALDFEKVRYSERRLLPGPHQLVTRRLARRSSVPVLVEGRRVIQGSSAILDYLEQEVPGCRLAPDARVAAWSRELESKADHAFGLGVQRIFYAVLLAERETVIDLWTQGGPFWGRAFYGAAYPLVARVVARMYKTQAGAVARAKDRFRAMM